MHLANKPADVIEKSVPFPRGWHGQSWRAVIIARSLCLSPGAVKLSILNYHCLRVRPSTSTVDT